MSGTAVGEGPHHEGVKSRFTVATSAKWAVGARSRPGPAAAHNTGMVQVSEQLPLGARPAMAWKWAVIWACESR